MEKRPVLLPAKTIKDTSTRFHNGAPPVLSVHDFMLGGFNFYVTIVIPHDVDHFNDDHPNDYISLHLEREGDDAFYFFNLLPKKVDEENDGGCFRKVLCMIPGHDLTEGRYLAKLLVDGVLTAEATFELSQTGVRSVPGALKRTDKAHSPFIVSGSEKSGTTWLEGILNAHADILVLHEGNLLNVVEFDTLAGQMKQDYVEFASREFIKWRPPYPNVSDYTQFSQVCVARALARAFDEMWDGRALIDRTPHYCDRYVSVLRHWPEAKILHITRHPLDVLVSRIFHEMNIFRNSGGNALLTSECLDANFLAALVNRFDSGVAPTNLLGTASFYEGRFDGLLNAWIKDQQYARWAAELFPDRVMCVTYEDLLDNPAQMIEHVYGFIGISLAPYELTRIVADSRFQKMSGGRRPGEKNNSEFFRNGQSGDYLNHLSPAQAQYCWGLVGEIARQFGYRLAVLDHISSETVQ